jgi:hypothetical protein
MRVRKKASALALLVLAAATWIGYSGRLPAEASPARVTAKAGWQVRNVLKLTDSVWNVAVDPAANLAYEMLTARPGSGRPFRLARINLATHKVTRGPMFQAAGMLSAAGNLWVYGPVVYPHFVAQLVLYQVNPLTLRVVRSWLLTPRNAASFKPEWVTAGPRGSVWIGYLRTLRRIDARTGRTLTRVTLPAGVYSGGISVDPASHYLYDGAVTADGATHVSEYSANTGRKLFTAPQILPSNAGSEITAVPGGVWASYRYVKAGPASDGKTVLLTQRRLSLVTPSASLFRWEMNVTTLYSGNRLWLGEDYGTLGFGTIGCTLATGQVVDQGAVPQIGASGTILAVSTNRRLVYAVGGEGVIAITPPRSCWAR